MESPPPAPVLPRPSPPDRVADRIRRWVIWFGLARLVAAGAAVVLVAFAAWWLLRAPRPPTESQLPYASTTTAASAPPAEASPPSAAPPPTAVDVVVHVAGAVAHPGVYHLPASSRVIDAVAAAGGLGQQASTDGVNLAAPVRDGTRIYVPVQGEAVPIDVGGGAPAATVPPGPLDVNTATAEQLDTLPGIGPSTAAAIIGYRERHGPFAVVDDLGEVRGIGPAKLDAIRELVTA